MLPKFSLLQTLVVLPTLYVSWNEVRGAIANYGWLSLFPFRSSKTTLRQRCCKYKSLRTRLLCHCYRDFSTKLNASFSFSDRACQDLVLVRQFLPQFPNSSTRIALVSNSKTLCDRL